MKALWPLSFFLLTSSCVSGPNYKRPAVEMPDKATDGKELPTDWWQLFGDPQLQILVQEALKNNQDLALSLARLDEARALAGVAKADYFPTFDLSGRFGEAQASEVGSSPLGTSSRRATFNQLGLVANYEIDFWGKFRRSNEAARSRLFEADYNRLNVQLQVTSLVAATYIRLRALDSQLKISQQTYQSRIESSELMGKRFKGGASSELDARQAEAEMWDAKSLMTGYEDQVNQMESSLAVLLGRSPRAILNAPLARGKDLSALLTPPELPQELSSRILERRPDILAAEQNLVAENARIGVAKSYYFPSISLFGGIGTDAQDIDNLFKGSSGTWSYGVNVYLPIFNAGRTGYLVEATTARQKQAVASYQKSIQIAFTEVRNSLKTIAKQNEIAQSRKLEVAALERNTYLAKLRYRNGQSPYLEVLDAERRLFQAQLSSVGAEQYHLTAIVDLYKALGGGWAAPQAAAN
jgi:multidrug efflux system outer membrane protein